MTPRPVSSSVDNRCSPSFSLNKKDSFVISTMAPNTKASRVTSPISTSPKDVFKDFEWTETDEPHATRRKLILAKHPEIRNLFGPEIKTFPLVVFIFITQMIAANWARTASWPMLVLVAYCYGGTVNHSLQLAVHELSHNLCFHTVVYNKLLAIFGNLVTGVPSGISFIKYHMEHHQYQGADVIDTDVPSVWEVNFFQNDPWKKTLWCFLQPAFYALRPLFTNPKAPTKWEFINQAVQFTFDYLVIHYWGWKAFAYLLIGTLLGLGLHPMAGHFISEHYTFVKGYETYSYYGPLNYLAFNVGYHNEHHDFPKIPWSRLAEVRKIAPEFYDDLPTCESWPGIIYRYITDPSIGPFSRVKRAAPVKKAR